jgi:hypothetical protein
MARVLKERKIGSARGLRRAALHRDRISVITTGCADDRITFTSLFVDLGDRDRRGWCRPFSQSWGPSSS